MTSAPPATSDAPGVTPACGNLTVAAQRLPGAAGQSFALLTFTNAGPIGCTLTGRPNARLLDDAHSPITAEASPADGPSDAVQLAPGASGSTLLVDDTSTCSVNTRSTYVRVSVPGLSATQDLAVALPPCSLSVKPVVAGTEPTP